MIVWLASYPRSGNTFFRVILNSVFNIKTYSIYNDTGDIGADEGTSDIVGHKFLSENFDLNEARKSKQTYYIKTHELLDNMTLDDSDKVIYLIRDGRESSLSFAKHRKNYYGKSDDLTDVLYGNTPFGFWGEHVKQWTKLDNYLLIKFEELTQSPTTQLGKISDYIGIETTNNKIPTFEELQQINPTFFRSGKQNSWKKHFSELEHLAFWLKNYNQMIAFSYTNDMPDETKQPSFSKYMTLFNSELNAMKKNIFYEKHLNQKIKILEEKLDQINSKTEKLKNTVHDLASVRFIASPLKKYQKYKLLLKLYKDI